MSTLSLKPLAKKLKFDSDNMWVELIDGRKLAVPLVYFSRLAQASMAQRKKYIISGGGKGLHWEALGEDISVPALLTGEVDRTVTALKTPTKVA